MKSRLWSKYVLILSSVFFFLSLMAYSPSVTVAAKPEKTKKAAVKQGNGPKANAGFEFKKMGDMSGFDAINSVMPTGDTIKIGLVASFTGPAMIVGLVYWNAVYWAVYDINQRGGIMVDGKKKMVELIKGDHMSKPDQCKKVVEKLITQDKVQFLWGTNGSNLIKIMSETANKYKVICLNAVSFSDELNDATNFNRYSFMTAVGSYQTSAALAYYYGLRKKEKKFYILCQDYLFGRDMADGFKRGLKDFYPEAKIVGEDYHKLFLTDFAPYLEKIKGSGAEVLYTADMFPDSSNLLKQMRAMKMTMPVANILMDDPNMLNDMGVEATKGLVNVNYYRNAGPAFKTPEQIKYYQLWTKLWKTKWATPFNLRSFEHAWTGSMGAYTQSTYWLLSVIERAKSTDPEKIIKVWEGDTYRFENGKVATMRACDHKVVQDISVFEFVPPEQQKESFNIPPYYWFKNSSAYNGGINVPASKVIPWMDPKLDRCKGKDVRGN